MDDAVGVGFEAYEDVGLATAEPDGSRIVFHLRRVAVRHEAKVGSWSAYFRYLRAGYHGRAPLLERRKGLDDIRVGE